MLVPSESSTPVSVMLGDACAEVEADTLGDVAGLDRLGNLGRHAAREEARQGLDDGDFGAELADGGGELETDEAAADDCEVPARAEGGADATGVLQRAKHHRRGAVGAGSGRARGRAPVASSRRS